MKKIRKLNDELISHIAAGEVVERPASVLKELVENAIDSGATKITIRVKKGGLELVEVADNGSGIEREDLLVAVEPHSTSKIASVKDLSEISTLGFRGEALASICAVSSVTIVTKTQGAKVAEVLHIENGQPGTQSKKSREQGTTVSVTQLFKSVPARKKFMKTPQSEYRKIVDTFIPIALAHPEMHFVLELDGKVAYKLPAVPDATSGGLHPQRVHEIFPQMEFVEVFYDGDGMMVGGFIAHPKHKASRTSVRYAFVNGRPIWDSGIAKAVQIGTGRFIPDTVKIPFLISLVIPLKNVDVNVHPRKTEVRFDNPYRVYSAVEAAVKRAYENEVGEVSVETEPHRLRRDSQSGGGYSDQGGSSQGEIFHESGSSLEHDQLFRSSRRDVESSIEFSRMVLEDSGADSFRLRNQARERGESASTGAIHIGKDDHIEARQFLGRYIVAEADGALLLIDQHAAAERIRFETLLEDYETGKIESQTLMIPVECSVAETEALFIEEFKGVFSNLGYEIKVKNDRIFLNAVPLILAQGDQEALFREIVADLQELEQFAGQDAKLNEKYRGSVMATMACHSSVRMNQRISDKEAGNLVKELFTCKNSYSCPHGRPIVWKLDQGEIDLHFDR